MSMASVLLLVFLLQLALHILNTIAAPLVTGLLWALYTRLPTRTAALAREQPAKRAALLKLNRELRAVSAQDQFSRWAKLRRARDAEQAALESDESALRSARTTFDAGAAMTRWLVSQGARILVQMRYAKEPLFWLPAGWMPGALEWLLAFPKAPTGGVSVQVWALACGSVIAAGAELLGALWAVVVLRKGKERAGEKRSEQVMEGSVATGEKRGVESHKKES